MILDRVKQLCDEKGIAIKTLEQAVGFGNGTIGKWEISGPSAKKVMQVADYFNVSIDYLMGRTDIKETANDGGLPEGIASIIHLCRADPRLEAFLLRQIDAYKSILADQATA